MRLESISLQNFRNYKKSEVKLNSDLVLILGENAAGKTNFLESIFFLSRLKSFRAPDPSLVLNGEDFFKLTGKIDSDLSFEAVVLSNPKLTRSFKINDKKTKRFFWQTYSVVLFVPNDLNLFHLGPVLRRKFFDETLSQKNIQYSLDLESLDHILKQKAALLEQLYQGTGDTHELEFWNQQLALVGMRITDKRQELTDFINSKLTQSLLHLTGFENNFDFYYKRTQALNEDEFLFRLNELVGAEIRSGKSLSGPHRDDFEIQKDRELNIYNSSRGELRTQVLALKLLQAEFLGQSAPPPLILLDDVFSELDETRRVKLIENLSGHQIFITSTEEHHLPKLKKDSQILRVKGNVITGI